MRDVLIVDDEYAIVDALSGLLEDEGYGVRAAANGRDALARIAEARPGILLVDLMMPVMDGRELVATLRADPQLRTLPIILLSAVPRSIFERHGVIEASAYLQKPFDVHELLATIANLIQASGQDATG